MNLHRTLSRLARQLPALALVAATCAAASAATAAPISLSGQIGTHKSQVLVDFSLSTAADVTLWTSSWQSGLNFDPMLSLFGASGVLLTTNDDDELATDARAFDAALRMAQLSAGSYRVVLTASPNAPLDNQLGAGFAFDGQAPIALADWNQPGYDLNANDQKGGYWQLSLDGVSQAALVPEPETAALWLAGLLVVARLSRRSRPR